METKYITIHFDVERAKRISNGEEEGKIVTSDGRNVRVVCLDSKVEHNYPIIALVQDGEGEIIYSYRYDGNYNSAPSNEFAKLLLSVPEWTTFKDGDIVTMGWENGDHYCKWISIIKVIDVFGDDICTRDYVTVCIGADSDNCFSIAFDSESDAAKWIRTSTEEEIHKLIEGLKESKDPRAKEYIKRFFRIEEKKECEFKPFDKVMVRDDDFMNGEWCADIFSHINTEGNYCCIGSVWKYCLPYNDQTAHLLGTSNDPE